MFLFLLLDFSHSHGFFPCAMTGNGLMAKDNVVYQCHFSASFTSCKEVFSLELTVKYFSFPTCFSAEFPGFHPGLVSLSLKELPPFKCTGSYTFCILHNPYCHIMEWCSYSAFKTAAGESVCLKADARMLSSLL